MRKSNVESPVTKTRTNRFSPSICCHASSFRCGAVLAVILAVSPDVQPHVAFGDVVRLKDAGEVRGVIVEKGRNRIDRRVVITTMTDGVVELDQDAIDSLSQRPFKVEEFLTLERRTPNTVPDRWALAEWCLEQGLMSRRMHQLERILELDPDHEPSHNALKHVRVDGEWMTREQQMEQQGYVKHGRKFITQQEFEIIQKQDELTQEVQAWNPKVKLWHTWLNGSKPERRETAYEELKQIDDPAAIPALSRYLGKDPQPPMREFYVDVLEQMPEASAVPPLVSLVLFDESDAVWKTALKAIPPAYASKSYPIFRRGLRHQANIVVRRAAVGLGSIGDETVIDPLIAALQTTHQYEVQVVDTSTPNYSFRTDGGFGGGGSMLPPNVELMMRTGQLPYGANVFVPGRPRLKWITVEKIHDNAEVVEALNKLTGENFGYDAAAWKYWLSRQKSVGASITTARP